MNDISTKKMGCNFILEHLIPNQTACSKDILLTQLKYYQNYRQTLNTTQPYNIVGEVAKYQRMNKILLMCDDHIAKQRVVLESADTPDQLQIQQFDEAIDRIAKQYTYNNAMISTLFQHRDFLTIYSPPYQTYFESLDRFEFDLWFLGRDVASYRSSPEYFMRVMFSEAEFSVLANIFEATNTPQLFLENVAAFLGKPEETIALCQFEQRYRGFIVFVKQSHHLNNELSQLSAKYPDQLIPLSNDNNYHLWLLNLDEMEIMKSKLFDLFSIWIDTSSLVVYANQNIFPITPDQSIFVEHLPNSDAFRQIWFGFIPAPKGINETDILYRLTSMNKFINPSDLQIFDGEAFSKLSAKSYFSICEIALMHYSLNSFTQFLVVYDCSKDVILDEVPLNTPELDCYIQLFKHNIALLNMRPIIVMEEVFWICYAFHVSCWFIRLNFHGDDLYSYYS